MPDENTTSSETTKSSTLVSATAPRSSWKQNIGIPAAIIIAAALIAGAIYLDGSKGGTEKINVQGGIDGAQNKQVTAETVIAPVTEADHIRGNPNAPILIVEYSDYDCPYCRIFHDTMTKIMADFEKSGKVAWVYRQFPLVELHPDAPKMSEAAYCVAEQTGNEGFWKYTDALNNSRKVEYNANGSLKNVEPTDMSRLTEFALAGGVDKAKFELCLSSGTFTEKVDNDVEAAAKTGARGTPYSIVMVGDQQGVLNGAQPYETVRKVIQNLIDQFDS